MGVMNLCLERTKWKIESGGTWHHPRASEAWLNNEKPSRSCNRVNLVETLRSDLVVLNVELGSWNLTWEAQKGGATQTSPK